MPFEHKLSQILPKLSQALITNDEILSILSEEITIRHRNASTISMDDSSANDLLITNPIFIFDDDICDKHDTLIDIGYKAEIDRIDYNYQNDEDRTAIAEQPYIVILSCKTKQKKKPISARLSLRKHNSFGFSFSESIEHIRSFTQNDIEYIPSPNMLSFEKYNHLRDCVSNFNDALSPNMTGEQLLEFINDSVEKYIDESNKKEKNDEKMMAVPQRKRSRAHSMIESEIMQKPPLFETKSENIHYGRTSSVPTMNSNLNGMQWMDLYPQTPQTPNDSMSESMTPTTPSLPQSFSKEAIALDLIEENAKEDDDEMAAAVVVVTESKRKQTMWDLDVKLLKKELLKMSKPKLIQLCKKNMVFVKMSNTKQDMVQRLIKAKKGNESGQVKATRARGKTEISKHKHSHSVTVTKKKKKRKKIKYNKRVKAVV